MELMFNAMRDPVLSPVRKGGWGDDFGSFSQVGRWKEKIQIGEQPGMSVTRCPIYM